LVRFTYTDHVLDDSSANVDVYQAVASEVVQNALLGINGTIFAYGQTSTGKTHTMFGSKEELGVMPLATKNIFKSIAMDTGREYLLRASYIEIYNENIRDLLNPNNDNLKIHQNPQGEIFVGDLSEQLVSSISEINELLAIGDSILFLCRKSSYR
jgi:centromeric protein E